MPFKPIWLFLNFFFDIYDFSLYCNSIFIQFTSSLSFLFALFFYQYWAIWIFFHHLLEFNLIFSKCFFIIVPLIRKQMIFLLQLTQKILFFINKLSIYFFQKFDSLLKAGFFIFQLKVQFQLFLQLPILSFSMIQIAQQFFILLIRQVILSIVYDLFNNCFNIIQLSSQLSNITIQICLLNLISAYNLFLLILFYQFYFFAQILTTFFELLQMLLKYLSSFIFTFLLLQYFSSSIKFNNKLTSYYLHLFLEQFHLFFQSGIHNRIVLIFTFKLFLFNKILSYQSVCLLTLFYLVLEGQYLIRSLHQLSLQFDVVFLQRYQLNTQQLSNISWLQLLGFELLYVFSMVFDNIKRGFFNHYYNRFGMDAKKAKLLKKYMGEVVTKRQHWSTEGLHFKDNQMELNESLSSSEEESVSNQKRKRIRSDSEDDQKQKKLEIQDDKKSKRMSKSMRKAFGLKKGEDAQQFLSAVKIEGMDQAEIEAILKKNKSALTFENKKQRKQKKKKEKKEKQQNSKIKLQNLSEKSSSDLQIPQQARTVYRNKDGTIREFSEAKQKEIKQKQVLTRLDQWQKGMIRESSSEQQMIDIWDDPAKRWQSKGKRHPLKCPYQGYANRFNIKPGFRWDGVIRGNGFENKCLQEINLRKAAQSRQNRDYLKNL